MMDSNTLELWAVLFMGRKRLQKNWISLMGWENNETFEKLLGAKQD